MQPNQPIQPVVGDHLAWPSREPQQLAPYGVSLNAGDLLSRAWQIFSADAARLIGITALPYVFMIVSIVGVIIAAVATGFDPDKLDAANLGQLVLVLGVGGGLFVSSMLLMIAAQAGTILATEERLRGEARGLGVVGALAGGLPMLGRMIGAYAIIGLCLSVLYVPAVGAAIYAVEAESFAIGGIAFVLFLPALVATFLVSLRVMPAGPAIVIEDLGMIDGLKRAIELTRGNTVDVFIAMLVLMGVMMGVNIATSIIGIIPLVGALVQLAVGVVIGAYQQIYIMLVYAGLRDRNG